MADEPIDVGWGDEGTGNSDDATCWEVGTVFRSPIDSKVWIAMPVESSHMDTGAGTLRAAKQYIEDFAQQFGDRHVFVWRRAGEDRWVCDGAEIGS